jgi:hypothetical protein
MADRAARTHMQHARLIESESRRVESNRACAAHQLRQLGDVCSNALSPLGGILK